MSGKKYRMIHVRRKIAMLKIRTIVLLYVLIVNAEKNKNVSLTDTCEQLREQLDEAHSKVEGAIALFFYTVSSVFAVFADLFT